MINYAAQFSTIAILHALAVASPGPDFAVVVKQSIQRGRALAVWTALGIGTGICVHTAYTLLGFGLLVKTSRLAFTVMKFIGATYLGYLGVRALWPRAPRIAPEHTAPDQVAERFAQEANARSSVSGEIVQSATENGRAVGDDGSKEQLASNTGASRAGESAWRAYTLGFWTNALNPKATLFFVAVISTVVNPATPRLILCGYCAWMAVTTALWFSLVATLFTQRHVRDVFLRMGPWFDRAMGVILLSLCVALALMSFNGK